MTVRATNRWYGISAVAFFCGAVGMLVNQPAVLLSSVIGLVFAAYARIETAPAIDIDIERTVRERDPAPGDEVQITATVHNRGGFVADLRIVDGVPPGLDVVDGSPRHGTALRPGEHATFTYTVRARRGSHAFGPATIVARNASGTVERETTAEGETSLTCMPRLLATEDVPLRALTTRYMGRVGTESGGEGVEFYATRAYRPGDSLSRVDWNRYARTGALSTIEFREERAADVVLLIDTREAAFLGGAGERDVHAVEQGIDAAGQIGASLLDAGDQVGLASLGPEWCYLPPRGGRTHRARIRRALATDPAFAAVPQSGQFFPRVWVRRLRKRVSGNVQFVAFSPLCDDQGGTLLRHLGAYDWPVTVISPDVTLETTAGERLSRTLRTVRIETLRTAGVRVVDWQPDRSLGVAITRAARRWA